MLPVDIPWHHAFDNAIALLHYNFVYVDFIRSMSCLYTYQGHNHKAMWDIINLVAHIPQAQNWPSVDFDHTFQAMTLGVPLTGHFQCQFLWPNKTFMITTPPSKTPRCARQCKKVHQRRRLIVQCGFPVLALAVHPGVIPQPSHVCPPKIQW